MRPADSKCRIVGMFNESISRTQPMTIVASPSGTTILHCETTAPADWNGYLTRWGYDGFHLRTEWAVVFEKAFRHQP